MNFFQTWWLFKEKAGYNESQTVINISWIFFFISTPEKQDLIKNICIAQTTLYVAHTLTTKKITRFTEVGKKPQDEGFFDLQLETLHYKEVNEN